MRTCSTRWKLPRRTRTVTTHAAMGTEMVRATPNSSSPAATPAYSAQVVPTFATSSAPRAAAARTPSRCLTRPMRPYPVTTSILGPEVVAHHQGDCGQEQDPEQLVAILGAEHGIGRDPGGILIAEAREEAWAPRTDATTANGPNAAAAGPAGHERLVSWSFGSLRRGVGTPPGEPCNSARGR